MHHDACVDSKFVDNEFEVLSSPSPTPERDEEWPDAASFVSRPITTDCQTSTSIDHFSPRPTSPVRPFSADIESPRLTNLDRAVSAGTEVYGRARAPGNPRVRLIDAARAQLRFNRPGYGRARILPYSGSIKPSQHISDRPTSTSGISSSIESQITQDQPHSGSAESSQHVPDRPISDCSTLSSIESQTALDQPRSSSAESLPLSPSIESPRYIPDLPG